MKLPSRQFWLFLSCLLLTSGCAAPKPILYPNAHFRQVGEFAAEQDIEDCAAMAKESWAIPSQAFKQFVNRCLQERGYEPVGWE